MYFTNSDISKIVGLKPRAIIYLSEHGIIQPKYSNGIQGRGKERRYSLFNVLEYFIAKCLRDSGVEYWKIKKILSGIDYVEKKNMLDCEKDLIFKIQNNKKIALYEQQLVIKNGKENKDKKVEIIIYLKDFLKEIKKFEKEK